MSAVVKIEGEVGRKFGIDWFADDGVVTHTAGTGSAYATAAAYDISVTPNTKVIAVDTGSGTILAGDIITIAGDALPYSVASTVGGSTVTSITLHQALRVDIADSVLVTAPGDGGAGTVGDHEVNMAFHRDCLAYATRPLVSNTIDLSLGSQIMSMQDPQTGLVLRLEASRQHKQVVWEFDILWGVKCVRPDMGVRIAGPTS